MPGPPIRFLWVLETSSRHSSLIRSLVAHFCSVASSVDKPSFHTKYTLPAELKMKVPRAMSIVRPAILAARWMRLSIGYRS